MFLFSLCHKCRLEHTERDTRGLEWMWKVFAVANVVLLFRHPNKCERKIVHTQIVSVFARMSNENILNNENSTNAPHIVTLWETIGVMSNAINAMVSTYVGGRVSFFCCVLFVSNARHGCDHEYWVTIETSACVTSVRVFISGDMQKEVLPSHGNLLRDILLIFVLRWLFEMPKNQESLFRNKLFSLQRSCLH